MKRWAIATLWVLLSTLLTWVPGAKGQDIPPNARDTRPPPVIIVTKTWGEVVAGDIIIKLEVSSWLQLKLTKDDQGVITTGLASLDVLNQQEGLLDIVPPVVSPKDPLVWPHLWYLLKFPLDADLDRLSLLYAQNEHVEFAHPSGIYRTTLTPNDTFYPQQWAHNASHLNSPSAWDLVTGSLAVPIAIIDTGMDWQHPDLEGNLWINGPEDRNGNGRFDNAAYPPGDLDGLDNDGNGYTDDVIGYDFYSRDPNPQHVTGDHGTRVAGLAAAVTSNGQGIAGVAGGFASLNQPGCRLMVLRAGDGTSITNPVEAINYAREKGAKVINMSWGTTSSYSGLEEAVRNAWNAGIVLVGAAGALRGRCGGARQWEHTVVAGSV